MTTKDTGGQAFPNEGFNGWKEPQQGMTLRDYFAAKALSGLLVNGENFNLPRVTAFCYEAADAMLKAREA